MSGRLAAWLAFVLGYAALSYASRVAAGPPEKDVLYRYDTAFSGAVQYAIVLAITLWIAHGPAMRERLGLRRPRSLAGALGAAIAVVVGIYVLSTALDPILHAAKEQGLTPNGWDASRAREYAANFVVVAGVAPVVEELLFRGVGYSLLARYGQATAIAVVGVTFGLVHGLVEGLVVLGAFGAALAWLRARTDSVYPCIAVHALFNAIAMVVAVVR